MDSLTLFPEPPSGEESSPPLALRCSPKSFESFFGQDHILAHGKLLRRAIESDRLGSVLFFGPPGTGKSALARLIAHQTQSQFTELNAVTAGVAELRKEIEKAQWRLQSQKQKTILLVDEIHHFNRSQQDALLPDVEKGTVTLIGITTENPYFYVNAALRSRSQIFEFFPLETKDLEKILTAAAEFLEKKEGVPIRMDTDAKEHLLRLCDGDARRLLNALEIGLVTTTKDKDHGIHFTLKIAEECVQKRAPLYDKSGDEHYDTASAFIKAMRGGDPDAALYWMAKMLEAGEDPRFIARRILIAASEDVGNAEPRALQVALNAFQAVELIGMPEARILLAQAATFISSAPKSNASYLGIEKALGEVRKGPLRKVPTHLKDSNLDRDARGHGLGYLYPHNYPGHWIAQNYMPDPKIFYDPSEEGEEKRIKDRLQKWRAQNRP